MAQFPAVPWVVKGQARVLASPCAACEAPVLSFRFPDCADDVADEPAAAPRRYTLEWLLRRHAQFERPPAPPRPPSRGFASLADLMSEIREAAAIARSPSQSFLRRRRRGLGKEQFECQSTSPRRRSSKNDSRKRASATGRTCL
jgi:hypothetical protein